MIRSRLIAASTLAGLLTLTTPVSSQPAATPPPAAEDEKAVQLFKAGKLDDALKELQKLAKANPQLPPARIRMSELLVKAGQGQAARSQLELAAAEDPRHPAVFLMNGSYAFGEGRITDTVLSCQAALAAAADPRWDADQRKKFTREARLGLAAAFEARRDWQAAKENLTAILNDDPKQMVARQRMAAANFWLGGPEQAFSEFQAIYKDDPTQELPEMRMAQLWGAREPEKSETWLKRAVTTHPKVAKSHRAYAGWLLDNARGEEAQVYVDSASKLDPNSRETLALRGLLARYKKDYSTAEQAFEALHKDYPNDAFAAWNLALTLIESDDANKKRRAVDLAEAEVRKNQRGAEGYAVLGWCYYKSGRLEEADKALGTAGTAGQVRLDTAYFMARLLADKMKYEEAHKILKEAVNGRGPFPYRTDAQALLTEVEAKLPKK